MNNNQGLSRRPFWARILILGTHPPVLLWFALLQAAAFLLLGSAHLAILPDPTASSEAAPTGDFAAFFTGASIVRSGAGPHLYDLQFQQDRQGRLFESQGEFWQPYLNPPALAALLAPAVNLGYIPAFRLFAGVQILLLVGALVYLGRTLQGIRAIRHGLVTSVLLILGFLPVATTAFGGQNTALTLGILSATCAAAVRGNGFMAGLALGLLTYKPQYAVLTGLALLLTRQWRAVAVSVVIAGLNYGIGAAVSGPSWPLHYLTMLSQVGGLEMMENSPWHFSLLPVVHRLGLGRAGTAMELLVVLTVLGLLLKGSAVALRNPGRFPVFFGSAVAAAMLLSPHLQYYEAGILALPVLLAVDTLLRRGGEIRLGTRALLVFGYLAYPGWRLSDFLGFQPLFLILVAVFLWTGAAARRVPDYA